MNIERLANIYEGSSLYLGGGIDSGVCMIPRKLGETKRFVAHFYKNHLPLSQLYFYQEITTQAAYLSEKENWKWDFGKKFGKLAIKVVPLEEILFYDGLPVGISEKVVANKCGGKNSQYFSDQLTKLSLFMNTRLNVTGIHVIPFNSQYTKKNGVLIATDLCEEIIKLKKVSMA